MGGLRLNAPLKLTESYIDDLVKTYSPVILAHEKTTNSAMDVAVIDSQSRPVLILGDVRQREGKYTLKLFPDVYERELNMAARADWSLEVMLSEDDGLTQNAPTVLEHLMRIRQPLDGVEFNSYSELYTRVQNFNRGLHVKNTDLIFGKTRLGKVICPLLTGEPELTRSPQDLAFSLHDKYALQNLEFLRENKKRLLDEYESKYAIIIKRGEVVGIANTKEDAQKLGEEFGHETIPGTWRKVDTIIYYLNSTP